MPSRCGVIRRSARAIPVAGFLHLLVDCFSWDDAGSLEGLEASTGRPLWHFNTGQGIRASPMTYAIDEVST